MSQNYLLDPPPWILLVQLGLAGPRQGDANVAQSQVCQLNIFQSNILSQILTYLFKFALVYHAF